MNHKKRWPKKARLKNGQLQKIGESFLAQEVPTIFKGEVKQSLLTLVQIFEIVHKFLGL